MVAWDVLAPTWQQLGNTWPTIHLPVRYSPNVRCFIGSREVTQLLDSEVTIRRGRDTVYQPTNAGYGSFAFVDLENVPVTVGDPVTVTIDDFQAQPVTIFTGKVSDFERRMAVFSPVEPEVVVRVQMVGPLADVSRRVVLFSGRAEEDDGERVLAVLQEAVPDIADPNLVDDGLFTLAALPAEDSGYDPLGVIQDAAFSSQGILFETTDGKIGYANGDRRFFTLRNDVVDIPLEVTAVDRFALQSQLADLVNEVVVEYGVDDAVFAGDADSVARFGSFDLRLRTVLANETNAEAFADEYLRRHALPRLQLEEIGIGLDVVDIVLFDRLLDLGTAGSADAIRVVGIPALLGITRFEGFVEGIEWRLTPNTGELRLLVSDVQLSVGSVRWSAVEPTLIWNDVDPDLTWDDARDVTDGGS
jgi:hypothetical protein